MFGNLRGEIPMVSMIETAKVNAQLTVRDWSKTSRPAVPKGKRLRRVPIHKHLIERKLLGYVEQRGTVGKPFL